MRSTLRAMPLAAIVALGLLPASRAKQGDPYAAYVRESRDFQAVPLPAGTAVLRAWPTWRYMPWPYRWPLPCDAAAAEWCLEHGYNGAVLDHGLDRPGAKEKLAWCDRFGLRFYVDHLAGKGDLHLWDGGGELPYKDKIRGTGVRPKPLDAALAARLKARVKQRIAALKKSPNRAAYALDDEVSWGHFTSPCMWRTTGDGKAFQAWLQEVYGPGRAPKREGWIGYDAIRVKLAYWTIGAFDASPLMDQWTFNDALFCNLIGELVTCAHELDPETPCGIVGAQAPSPFGGYDYARLLRKVGFIEAYDLGSAHAIIRSFKGDRAVPVVTTHFHRSDPARPGDVTRDVFETWYYLARGNTGRIGWTAHWFDRKTGKPLPWHAAVAPTYLEVERRIAPLMRDARRIHDGVALYYSHPSIQLGWILDAQAHVRTWANRHRDHRLGSAPLVRRAWENMLRDEGIQYTWISYVDAIQEGIPPSIRVLILPAVLCLSNAEAERIRAFCRKGGTVIADYLPGLWDEHGRGRKNGGVLDDLFGVRHDPGLHAQDVFQKKLWVEVDQEEQYGYRSFETFYTQGNTCLEGEGGFHKAVREGKTCTVHRYEKGTAVLFNLSPQRYNAYRAAGPGPAARRAVFMKPVRTAACGPWVRLETKAPEKIFGYEITYWAAGGRTLLFVVSNPDLPPNVPEGMKSAASLRSDTVPVKLVFTSPVEDLRDERAAKPLGPGKTFPLSWKMNEALVLSFRGAPPPQEGSGPK